MVILGFALKGFGFASKFVAMAVAPVVAVLAWGAIEQARDTGKTPTTDAGTSL
jgi:hypothetical protein